MAPRRKITAKAEANKRRALQQEADPAQPETHFIQLAAIWHVIAETMNVDLSIVAHNNRSDVYVTPRHIFFLMARKHTTASLREIGQYAGGRDHSSVINGCKRIQDLIDTEKRTRDLVDRIERNLTGRVPEAEDPEMKIKQYPAWFGFIG